MSKVPTATNLTPAQIQDIIERRPEKNALHGLATEYKIGTQRVRKIWSTAYGGPDLRSYRNWLANKKEIPLEPSTQATSTKTKDDTRIATASGKVLKAASPRAVPSSKSSKSSNRKERVEQVELDVAQVEAGNNSGDLIKAVKRATGLAKTTTKAALRSAEMSNELARSVIARENYEDDSIDEDGILSYESDSCATRSSRSRRKPSDYANRNVPIQSIQQTERIGSAQSYNNVDPRSFGQLWDQELSSGSSTESDGEETTEGTHPQDRSRRKTRARPVFRSSRAGDNSRQSAPSSNKSTTGCRQQVSNTRYQSSDSQTVSQGYHAGSYGDIGGRGFSQQYTGGSGGQASGYAQAPAAPLVLRRPL